MVFVDSVNERIIKSLQNKKIPWNYVTRNVVSKHPYKGINTLILGEHAARHNFKSCYWGTFNQWQMLGAKVIPRPEHVKIGDWGARIAIKQPCTVFNLEQIQGGFETLRTTFCERNYTIADKLITKSGAKIDYKLGLIARYFYPPLDYIILPLKKQFECGSGGLPGFYYAVFHELMHWSEPRLSYEATELICELRSEIGAGMLAAELGVPNITFEQNENHQHYVEYWIKLMVNNPLMIFDVAEAASKAVDYLLAFGKPR